ncbi:nickel ABC transporter ATP-binding protein NikE [Alphaproteobacteria bacterium LSUCC0684]
MAEVIRTNGLSVRLREKTLLDGLDLVLEKGRILGITGESGSGKSLTALALMDLLPQPLERHGEILLEGQRIDRADDNAMSHLRGRRMALVFQEPMTALNPLLPIGEQVAEVFRQHRRMDRTDARRKAGAVLERVGLGREIAPPDRLPHELSGGQRQRVVIAMAIALGPALLIADEPTTSLDVTTQKAILDLLRSLVMEDGMAMILITHDLAVIAETADDILLLKDGKPLATGPVQLLARPSSIPELEALITASSGPAARPAGSAMADTPPLLEVREVSHGYPSSRRRNSASAEAREKVLTDVSFTITRGETVGLVGRSGCGKTTLSQLVLGLAAPQSGQIRLAGERLDARHVPRRSRRQISAVFQDPFGSFNPRRPVAWLVAEPLHLLDPAPDHGRKRQLALEALEAVGLDASFLDRLIHECSGGQRQRIAFARALVTRPSLIVLDEPVSALDAPIRQRILALMAETAQAFDIATLFISHDLSVVRSVCPRVMVLADGRLVEDGETETVFTHPGHPETARLLAAAPDLTSALARLEKGRRGQRGDKTHAER